MRPSTIFYILKQGVKNIRRNWTFSVASVLTMIACIFLLGLGYSIVSNVSYITQGIEEKVPITVFFNEGISEDQINAIRAQIETRPEVASIEYESPEQALEEYAKIYENDEEREAFLAAFKADNPFADSANFQVSMNDISKQNALVAFIKGLDGVRKIEKSNEAARTLDSFNRVVYSISVVIIGILLLISVFLISNTISVGISIRKEEIGIMKYIGATDRFVRAPFVLEGIVLGTIGAAIPLVGLYFLYNRAVEYILTRYSVLSSTVRFLSVQEIYRNLIPIGLILGIGIGLIGSFWTTRKHLRV